MGSPFMTWSDSVAQLLGSRMISRTPGSMEKRARPRLRPCPMPSEDSSRPFIFHSVSLDSPTMFHIRTISNRASNSAYSRW